MDVSSDDYEKILKCIDLALGCLGESVKRSLYYYLEKDFMLKKFDIPKRPEAFENALKMIFGEQGKKVIEKMILTEIKNKFKLKKFSGLTFVEVIKAIEGFNNSTK